ncbi:MAG: response regulator transcription factor [Bacteroidota bacterium]
MKKCIIIDDEKNCRIALNEVLKASGFDIEVIHETGDALQAYELIMTKQLAPDIVFLDIQMPGCDGFSFIKKFDNMTFRVVFTTAYDQYAIRAIKFSAVDYLLKPIDLEDIKQVLTKIFQDESKCNVIGNFKNKLVNNTIFDTLVMNATNERIQVAVADILYIARTDNTCKLFLNTGEEVALTDSLDYYEDILLYPFYRVHDDYLVNLSKLKKQPKYKAGVIEIENGTSIAIAGRRKEELLELLNKS